MTVKSKFEIGDNVWFVSNNKVHQLEITGVEMYVALEGTKVKYNLYDNTELEESKVFATKEELLESL